ncbi:MAG: hypothetical protein ACTHNM_17150 [Dyella sp.]|uniref:hypothetical protein n=1 Tax=Dyella sp. TaxID=1869338 RepID=UPI003F807EDC
MKASFTIDNPAMLAEASAGDLFVPLGPDLVECVCALRCIDTLRGVATATPNYARLNPDVPHDVVVVACRVGPGEPEYFPPGYCTQLAGAAPVVFLAQAEALRLQPRLAAPASSLDAMLDRLEAAREQAERIASEHIERFHASLHVDHSCSVNNPAHAVWAANPDLTRPELASQL